MRKLRTILSLLLAALLIVTAFPDRNTRAESSVKTGIIGAMDEEIAFLKQTATIDRAVSIREAARLQTFPDSFIFCGTKDSQYQQVGNAVPPMLAKAIAEHLAAYLEKKKNGR